MLAALACLVSSPGVEAQDKPYLSVFGESTRPQEGDADHVVQIEWMFSRPPTSEVRFTVRTDETVMPSATPGVDYVVIPPTEVVVPAGQQAGSTPLVIKGDTIVESSEMLFMKFYNFRGGGTAVDTGSGETPVGILIMDDDVPPQPPLAGTDDHVLFEVNEGITIFPGVNDVDDPWNVLKDTVTTVLQPPAHGTLTQLDYGSGIDYFAYEPEPDFAGEDRFRYRLCKSDGLECVEATVFLSGQLESPVTAGGRRSGGFRVELARLPALADARYLVSTLAHARRVDFQTGVDPTPHLPWDSRDGVAWTSGTLPASPPGETIERRIHVRSAYQREEAIEFRVGLDRNGDGQPSADEQVCVVSGVDVVVPGCVAKIQVGAEPVPYWVAVHSREGAAHASAVNIFEIRMDDPESRLRATGPVTVGRDAAIELTVSWADGLAFGPMAAFVEVRDGDRPIGDFRIDAYGGDGMLLLPTHGETTPVALYPSSAKWWEDRGLFFDVPPGAQSLSITMGGDTPISFAPYWFGYEERDRSVVWEYGSGEPDSSYVQVPAGQARTVTVAAPRVGRWYALVRNLADAPARVEVRVDVAAAMPAIRPGSYFNPSRPGHGLLLYPAGDQWAGLWYTYDPRARPTWFYLQAPKPGSDGSWRSSILRSAWNGTSARLLDVGVMQVTPLGDDRFLMSYMIDGDAGSQVMEPLGRGCPARDGQPLDISSHWFDPARSGNGYSVQTWADGYQFIAAFTYDEKGSPLFLAAERPDLGGDVADLPLELLNGSCQTNCNHLAPRRQSVGVLRRTLAGGTLAEIELDVDYTLSWPYEGSQTFHVIDRVQPLGGPGSTQGCEP
ncbi:MAG: hypothetical protein A2X76_00135 [Lysobacterales bacterium GWF1_69_6]|nr:MAG: hypothetical protein A2X76_00135 [Xanthomonadales bacterium GWF1_69_6]